MSNQINWCICVTLKAIIHSREGFFFVFFCHDTATTKFYTLSLHDALPIYINLSRRVNIITIEDPIEFLHRDNLANIRSEEHTSELQSQSNLVCRLLLEKKKHRCNPDLDEARLVTNHHFDLQAKLADSHHH